MLTRLFTCITRWLEAVRLDICYNHGTRLNINGSCSDCVKDYYKQRHEAIEKWRARYL